MKILTNRQKVRSERAKALRIARIKVLQEFFPAFLKGGVGVGHLYAGILWELDAKAPLSPRRARIRHAIAPLARHILAVRDASVCALCGSQCKIRLGVHHILPVGMAWARVGDPTNLITLCHRCHLDRAHGGSWSTLDPDLCPVLHRIAEDRERNCGTPLKILTMVQRRLAILGREWGRA